MFLKIIMRSLRQTSGAKEMQKWLQRSKNQVNREHMVEGIVKYHRPRLMHMLTVKTLVKP